MNNALLFKSLKKCNIDKQFYDLTTKTLNVPFLNCTDLNDNDLVYLDGIEKIMGDLIISAPSITNISTFNSLLYVENLIIQDMDKLNSITGFNNLKHISSLIINENKNLEKISGFKQLFLKKNSIAGALKITNNPLLESISFLQGLVSVASSFYLHYNNLKSLKGLESLESVEASFSLSSNNLTSLQELNNLKRVDGMLGVVDNSLETLAGLENLEYLKTIKWSGSLRTLAINGNPKLRDISALEKLTPKDNDCIILVDAKQNFTHKLSWNSIFSKNNINVFAKDKKEPLSKSKVCFMQEESSTQTKVLNQTKESKTITKQNELIDFFNQRFLNNAYNLDSISLEESSAILYLLPLAIKNNKTKSKTITLIDYGCGDGRLHPLYEIIAKSFVDYTFQIIAVDFSDGALSMYHKRCLDLSYSTFQANSELLKHVNTDTNYPLSKDNIHIYFKTSDISALLDLRENNINIEIIIAAGVLCRVLGPQNRLEMISTFNSISDFLFLSQPSKEDFASIHKNFSIVRKEKEEKQNQLSTIENTSELGLKLQSEISEINAKLKDALVEGEIYYKAGIVRGLDKQLPDFKDHKIPFFATDLDYAKELLSYAGYKHHVTFKGANGSSPLKKWFISIASRTCKINFKE